MRSQSDLDRRTFLKVVAAAGLAAGGTPIATAQGNDILDFTATEAVAELKAGRISSEEIVTAALDRAEKLGYMNLFTAIGSGVGPHSGSRHRPPAYRRRRCRAARRFAADDQGQH